MDFEGALDGLFILFFELVLVVPNAGVVDLHLKIVEEQLFLLSNRDTRMTFDRFHLIKVDGGSVAARADLADVLRQPLLRKLGEVLLLEKPVVVVPD